MAGKVSDNAEAYYDPERNDSWVKHPQTGQLILAGYDVNGGPLIDRVAHLDGRVARVEAMLEMLLARLEKAAERD